ncbi:MAG: hypothetical protein R2709_10720 [Marmoricola sp.]
MPPWLSGARQTQANPRSSFSKIADGLGMIELDLHPSSSPVHCRAYAHFRWSTPAGVPVSLEGELEEEAWYLLPADTDVFLADPTHLRRDVLARQPGSAAWHATRPMDPSQN